LQACKRHHEAAGCLVWSWPLCVPLSPSPGKLIAQSARKLRALFGLDRQNVIRTLMPMWKPEHVENMAVPDSAFFEPCGGVAWNDFAA